MIGRACLLHRVDGNAKRIHRGTVLADRVAGTREQRVAAATIINSVCVIYVPGSRPCKCW